MNKKLSLKQIGCLAIVILLAGMIAAISNGYYERKVVFDQRAKIVGSIAKKEPERLDKIMIALKDEDQESKAYGKAILEKYGYQEKEMGIVSIQNLSIELLVSIGLIIVLGVLWQREKRRQDKRIESLSSYLNQGINGQSKIQVKGTEDEFALLEDELYKTVNELYQTRETALKEKVVLKDHLADIAHQLKTPLTSMGLMCELLNEPQELSLEEQKAYAEQIQNQISRLEELVHALLLLSKLEANVIELKQEKVEVYILILRVVELLEPMLKAQNQQIVLMPEADHSVSFRGDMKWSIEALYNLVKNALQHTPSGKKVMIRYAKTPLFTEILVEDEGEGFAKEDIPYLFKRFYKGKNARKDSIGIGLALSETIIKQQNGIIEAENREEGGARFRVKIYPAKMKASM